MNAIQHSDTHTETFGFQVTFKKCRFDSLSSSKYLRSEQSIRSKTDIHFNSKDVKTKKTMIIKGNLITRNAKKTRREAK